MNTRITSAPGKRILFFVLIFIHCSSCTHQEHQEHHDAKSPEVERGYFLPDAPANIADSIRKQFPGAAPVHVFADSLLTYVSKKYNITTEQILRAVLQPVWTILFTPKTFRITND